MGTNNLVTKNTGDAESVDDFNQYKTAMEDDLVPRSDAGVPQDLAGSIGSESLKWIKAKITKGYWSAGDIKAHHSYNGATPVDQGWFPCDGSVINETNYNAVHGSGAWDTYVISSVFDGKYSPNLVDKYITGAASTTQDGTAPIASVGSNTFDISHTHTDATHVHQWYESPTGASSSNSFGTTTANNAQSYNSSGVVQDLAADGSGRLTGNYYTKDEGPAVDSESITKSSKPESIEITYYIRII